jgi:periplasmic protein CpxP/Spy
MDQIDTKASGADKRQRRRTFFKGLFAGGLIGSLAAASFAVFSQYGGWMHGGCGMRHAMHDPAAVAERMEFASDWMLSRIGASEEQKTRVRAIVKQAVADLAPLRSQHLQRRQQLRDALVQPAIDRDAVNRLRQEELQLADQASARIQEAVLAAAEVLTPEQRKALLDRMHRHGGARVDG